MNPDIFIPSIRPLLAEEANKCLDNKGIMIDGSNIPNYSWMINQCILKSKTNIVIICHDRARPQPHHVDKIINLIESGFGFVGLYCFGFYGIHKDVVRRIGPLDERYVFAGYEDCDYLRRVIEADIAYYESREVYYIQGMTTFNTTHIIEAQKHFKNKWYEDDNYCIRLMKEEIYNYKFGIDTGKVFKSGSESILCPESMYFMNKKFKDHTQ